MSITTDQVPERFDVAFTGGALASAAVGLCFADQVEPNLPFRTHRAIYDISPTFIERTNTSGAFGDNQQDFWLTSAQNDWSGGEGQHFFRSTDKSSVTQYWSATNIDVSTEGQVTVGAGAKTLILPSAVRSVIFGGTNFYALGGTDLFQISGDGNTVTALGAHGVPSAGNSTVNIAMATDGFNVFMGSGAINATGLVRKWNGSTFTTFTASQATSLAFLNNTLYGYNADASAFGRWDTSGNWTSLFQWKGADGGTLSTTIKLAPFGGKMVIGKYTNLPDGGFELWIYDGVGVQKLAVFEANFNVSDLCAAEGIIWLVGLAARNAHPQGAQRAELRYLANGSPGVAWVGPWSNTGAGSGGSFGLQRAVCPFQSGVLFTEPVDGAIMYYDLSSGAAYTVGSYTPGGSGISLYQTMAGGATSALLGSQLPGASLSASFASLVASSATLQTSLFDFESSLDKLFRGVKVDWVSASGDAGGTVDVAYQVGSLDGAYTTIGTGVTSGQEISFGNSVVGRNVGLRLTLNKNGTTTGPIVKRTYIRAAPLLQQFRTRTYIFDCSDYRTLRDGTRHPLTGFEQVRNLATIAQQQTPFTVTDRLGSFTALVDVQDPEGFDIYEMHPSSSTERPGLSGTYVARIKVREV